MADTQPDHQDAGTIKLNPELRNETDKKERNKGKEKISRTSPPVTRARKRHRPETVDETRTASQDSCTPRNPLQAFRPSEGCTPCPPRPGPSKAPGQSQHTTEVRGEKEIGLIRTALELTNHPTHDRGARRLIWGIIDLLQKGALEFSTKDLENLDKQTMDTATRITLDDDLSDLKADSNATRGASRENRGP